MKWIDFFLMNRDFDSSIEPIVQNNRSFATNDHMVQNQPYWRASSLLFPHWDIKRKVRQA